MIKLRSHTQIQVILLGLCWFVSTFWIYERVLRVDLRIALDGVRFDSKLVSRIFPAILSYAELQQVKILFIFLIIKTLLSSISFWDVNFAANYFDSM